MANVRNSTLYAGVTGDLFDRVRRHKTGEGSKFTTKYKTTKLVYYEEFQYINDAIAREKEMKGWSRKKKDKLIHSLNPLWDDLSDGWFTG